MSSSISRLLGNKKIDEITRSDIRALIASKVDEGLSKATVRNIMAPLRQMLGHAVEDSIIPADPASKLGRFSKETSAKANAKKIVPYTAAEVQTMLRKAQEQKFELYAFLLTAILTGMRLGELLGFQWIDLDLHNKCIHVKRAVSRRPADRDAEESFAKKNRRFRRAGPSSSRASSES